MIITVSRFRATLLWTWTGEELLPANAGAVSGYWVSSREQYKKVFDALRQGESVSHGVSFPWPPGHLQRFWATYTAETGHDPKHQRDISANTAFLSLIPFRLAKLVPGVGCPEGVILTQEAFLLPVGLAIALSIDVKFACPLVLDQAADSLITLCSSPLFHIPGSNEDCSLLALRDHARAKLPLIAAVPEIQNRVAPSKPFSLVTITRAGGATADGVLATDNLALKALQTMSSLPDAKPRWRDTSPTPLEDSVLPRNKNHPSAHFCFTSPNGRCVWHPRYFGPEAKAKEVEGLNCYHRNLLFGALQVQSLANFLRLIQGQRKNMGNLNYASDKLARKACHVLGRLYGKAAYHSWSVRQWIDDHPDNKSIIENERGTPLHG